MLSEKVWKRLMGQWALAGISRADAASKAFWDLFSIRNSSSVRHSFPLCPVNNMLPSICCAPASALLSTSLSCSLDKVVYPLVGFPQIHHILYRISVDLIGMIDFTGS